MPDQQTIEKHKQEREERRQKNAAERSRYRKRQREKQRASAGERATAAAVAPKEHGPGRPKVRQGVVVSAKPDKTITVRIDVTRRHRTYKKIVRESSTLHAHDERNDANEGDTVRVVETRPSAAPSAGGSSRYWRGRARP
jgi:small subunit ribosomal protein S17